MAQLGMIAAIVMGSMDKMEQEPGYWPKRGITRLPTSTRKETDIDISQEIVRGSINNQPGKMFTG